MYIGEINLPVATRPLWVGRERERGSVLVMCLGILVVMALMATAFISSVTLQRDSARNYDRNAMAELAALSGKAHAIKKMGSLAAEFQTGGTIVDMWRFYGIADITDASDKQFINATYQGRSKWFNISWYNKNCTETSTAGGLGTNYPYELRYAVAAVDLAGCIPLNMMNATDMANTDALFSDVKFSPAHNAAYSFLQIGGKCPTVDMSGVEKRYLMVVTPFASDALSYSLGIPPVNVTLGIVPVGGAPVTRFFRVMVRGQLYDYNKTAVISEANLEFVYNNTGGCTMYQRWILDD
jgi:hypothetical protein